MKEEKPFFGEMPYVVHPQGTQNLKSDFYEFNNNINRTSRNDESLLEKEHCICLYCLKGTEKFRNGKRIHLCPFEGCGKIYYKPNDVCFHLPIHTGDMSYVCPVLMCKEKFKSREEFARHERVHTSRGKSSVPYSVKTFCHPMH